MRSSRKRRSDAAPSRSGLTLNAAPRSVSATTRYSTIRHVLKQSGKSLLRLKNRSSVGFGEAELNGLTRCPNCGDRRARELTAAARHLRVSYRGAGLRRTDQQNTRGTSRHRAPAKIIQVHRQLARTVCRYIFGPLEQLGVDAVALDETFEVVTAPLSHSTLSTCSSVRN
jgi:hypothetical protein